MERSVGYSPVLMSKWFAGAVSPLPYAQQEEPSFVAASTPYEPTGWPVVVSGCSGTCAICMTPCEGRKRLLEVQQVWEPGEGTAFSDLAALRGELFIDGNSGSEGTVKERELCAQIAAGWKRFCATPDLVSERSSYEMCAGVDVLLEIQRALQECVTGRDNSAFGDTGMYLSSLIKWVAELESAAAAGVALPEISMAHISQEAIRSAAMDPHRYLGFSDSSGANLNAGGLEALAVLRTRVDHCADAERDGQMRQALRDLSQAIYVVSILSVI